MPVKRRTVQTWAFCAYGPLDQVSGPVELYVQREKRPGKRSPPGISPASRLASWKRSRAARVTWTRVPQITDNRVLQKG